MWSACLEPVWVCKKVYQYAFFAVAAVGFVAEYNFVVIHPATLAGQSLHTPEGPLLAAGSRCLLQQNPPRPERDTI